MINAAEPVASMNRRGAHFTHAGIPALFVQHATWQFITEGILNLAKQRLLILEDSRASMIAWFIGVDSYQEKNRRMLNTTSRHAHYSGHVCKLLIFNSVQNFQQRAQLCAGACTSVPDIVLHARKVPSPDPAAIQNPRISRFVITYAKVTLT